MDRIISSLSESLSVLGDIPNLAARLQSEADPNTMVVSEGTHRLLETTEVPYMLSQVLGLLFSTRRFSQTTRMKAVPFMLPSILASLLNTRRLLKIVLLV